MLLLNHKMKAPWFDLRSPWFSMSILLAFFSLAVPGAASATQVQRLRSVDVTIGPNMVYINGHDTQINELRSRLAKLSSNLGSEHVYLRCARRASYGTLTRVIEILKTAGAKNITIEIPKVSVQT